MSSSRDSVGNTDNKGKIEEERVKIFTENYNLFIKSSDSFNEAINTAYKNQNPPQEGNGCDITYHIQQQDFKTCKLKFAELDRQLTTFINYVLYQLPELLDPSSRFFSKTSSLNEGSLSELKRIKFEVKSVYDRACQEMSGELYGIAYVYKNPTRELRNRADDNYEHSSLMNIMFGLSR